MKTYIFIGCGGIIGAILRYSLANEIQQMDQSFPWGTLAINLLGCFALGLLSFLVSFTKLPLPARNGITTGLIGSFTTFSTFCVESDELLREGHMFQMFLYLLLSLFGGYLMAFFGMYLAESLESCEKKGAS